MSVTNPVSSSQEPPRAPELLDGLGPRYKASLPVETDVGHVYVTFFPPYILYGGGGWSKRNRHRLCVTPVTIGPRAQPIGQPW